LTADWYAPMNVNIAPFNNLKARQAVNYALNKNSLVSLYGGRIGGADVHDSAAGFPRYLQYCAYNSNSSSPMRTGHREAKALVKGRAFGDRSRWLRKMTRSMSRWASTSRACSTKLLQGLVEAALAEH